MRVFSWAFWRMFFHKADDALARAMPPIAFPQPELQPQSAIEPAIASESATRAPPRPLAKQMAVQRHLARLAKCKRKQRSRKPIAKKPTKPYAAQRKCSAVNRPRSKRAAALKRNAGKKRSIPRRHVWLSAKR